MEAINHEYYVSLEVAKLLKEAGFKWFVSTAYRDGVIVRQKNSLYDDFNRKCYENSNSHGFFSAPTLEVAQRWLREVKNVAVEVKVLRWVNRYQNGKYTISYIHEVWPIDTSIVPNKENKFIRYTIDCVNNIEYQTYNIEFQTYEEALETGIKKALELILDKGE